MTKRIFIPTDGPEDWKRFLADPDRHWKHEFSAFALAQRWEQGAESDTGLAPEVSAVLAQRFETPVLLFAVPEHRVPFPGGGAAPQNDVWALVRSRRDLISLAVEGKAEEAFDVTVGEWHSHESHGKAARLDYLVGLLGLEGKDLHPIRYQFLHCTASAVLEAERCGAGHAVMLVHSFSRKHTGFEDYAAFAQLFGLEAKVGTLLPVKGEGPVRLYLGWADGS
jgi:hypothetical protein